MTHLYKIRDKNKNLILLNPNIIQQAIIKSIEGMKPIRAFYLKYRQGGVSTWWLIWWLDDTIFHKNTITGILSHERESLGYLFEIIRLAYKEMPKEWQPRLDKDSQTTLTFPDINSKIFVSLSIRSTAVHNLHISEWCYIEDTNVRASLGAVSPTSNVTGESTGNGVGNDGYITYTEAEMGLNGFKPMFFPWWIQPEYRVPLNGLKIIRTNEESKLPLDDEQVLFRRLKKRELKTDFPKEMPESEMDAFMSAGKNYFNHKKIIVLMKEAKEYVKEHPPWQQTDDYIAWEEPSNNYLYVAAADPAEGIGADYSVLSIINVTKRTQAFRFRARVGIDNFYRICDEWGRKYNNALLAPERNNHGHAVILGLYENSRYPNLYDDNKYSKRTTFALGKHNYGWATTTITRPLMLDQLKFAIEGESEEDEQHFEPELLILDQELLNEMLTFEEHNGKYQAADGKNDDCIFAWAIALQLYLRVGRFLLKPYATRLSVGSPRQINEEK